MPRDSSKPDKIRALALSRKPRRNRRGLYSSRLMGRTETGGEGGGLVPLRSGIAYIDEQAGELLYRGHNIHDIAEKLSFEQTVFLLWQGRLPAMDESREFAD